MVGESQNWNKAIEMGKHWRKQVTSQVTIHEMMMEYYYYYCY